MKLAVLPLLFSPKGVRKPPRAAWYAYCAFRDVQQWYKARLGTTFNLLLPQSFTGALTWAGIGAKYGGNYFDNGFNIWHDALEEIGGRGFNLCDSRRGLYLLYFHPPLPDGNGNPMGLGGMVGAENWGCGYQRPGVACMGDRMALLMCGLTSPQIEAKGWPHDWPDSPNHPRGGIAHEIVHMVSDLPHAADGDSITNKWFYWPDVGFLPEEQDALLATGALA